MIRFEGVHKWFKKLHVLNDVNLHVKQGEVLVVCGPSGSGKSTLIRTVNSLEPIDKGKLIVDGQDLSDRKTDINKLRADIGPRSGDDRRGGEDFREVVRSQDRHSAAADLQDHGPVGKLLAESAEKSCGSSQRCEERG